MDKKDKNYKQIGYIITSIGIIIIICSFIVFLVSKNNSKNNVDNKDNNENNTIDVIDDNVVYDGEYVFDSLTVKIYKINSTSINYYSTKERLFFSINDAYSGFLEMNGNVGKSIKDDEIITFDFEQDLVDIKFNKKIIEKYPYFLNGTYARAKEYTAKDYYEDNIGKYEYFNSNYNGLYVLNGHSMYVFQINEEDVFVVFIANTSSTITSYENIFKIKDENTLKIDDSSLERTIDSITFKKDSLIVDSSVYSEFIGEYLRKNKISVEEAVSFYE